MSAFYDAIDAYYDATTASDRLDLRCAPAIMAEFDSSTQYLWGGFGRSFTPDGAGGFQTWNGWHSGDPDNPQSYIQVPSIGDGRDGASPLYSITLGYLNEEQYLLLRDSEEEVTDRPLTIYNVYLPDGKSTRTPIPPGHGEKLVMQGVKFAERRSKQPDGSHKVLRTATLTVKNNNQGRSRQHFGAMNSVGQRFRSEALFGVTDDAYADFTPAIAGGILLTLN